MATAYIGEIRSVGFGYAPQDWLPCDGRSLQISDGQYAPLFALIGTTYGGDGVNLFQLPNLLSRVPVSQGSLAGHRVSAGQVLGHETVTLQSQQVGAHNHALNSGAPGNTQVPNGAAMLSDPSGTPPSPQPLPSAYSSVTTGLVPMSSGSIAAAGGTDAHENRQPFLAINFIICISGIFPPRN